MWISEVGGVSKVELESGRVIVKRVWRVEEWDGGVGKVSGSKEERIRVVKNHGQ